MLSVKQGVIKYHFLSLWYDSTWDWIQVSRAIGEHSNHHVNANGISADGKTPSPMRIWQQTVSDRESSVLELWGMWITPLLALLPGSL